ncbi:MAG: thermonuclease family protein [Planctomycetota bacterium]
MVSLPAWQAAPKQSPQPAQKARRSLNARQVLAKFEALTGPEDERWDRLFADELFSDSELAGVLQQLHEAERRESAILCLESALRAGRVAPWLYDLLALQMKLAGRPPEEIGRVLQSRLDFGVSSVPDMLVTAAMLSRFEAWDASLTLLRDAAQLKPNLAETWLLYRSVADKSADRQQQLLARLGILEWVWTNSWEKEHAEAVKVIDGIAKELESRQLSAEAATLRERLAAAQLRDLQITLRWVGNADLDLLVQDPAGEECSFRRPETSTFGRLVKQDGKLDATRSRPAETHVEQFIQLRSQPGRYTAVVRFVGGRVASGTAVLEVIQYAGTPRETRQTQTIRVGTDDTQVIVETAEVADRQTGTWHPVSATLNGEDVSQQFRDSTILRLAADQYSVTVNGTPDRGTCRVDRSVTPWKMQLDGTVGPNKGKTLLAIFQLTSTDRLRICYDLDGSEYPSEFSATDTGRLLVEYRRELPAGTELSGVATEIPDSDILLLKLADGQQKRIRLNGIDAPELPQPWGTKSREQLEALVQGRTLRVVTQGEDRAGQIIGDAWFSIKAGAPETLLNVELVERGLAWHFVRFAPDNRILADAEQRARTAKKGLWSDPAPTAPWDWRRQQNEQPKK